MARARTKVAKPGGRSGRSSRSKKRFGWLTWLLKLSPKASARKRWWRSYRRASFGTQVVVGLLAAASAFLAINVIYQIARKPTELFFPVSGTLYKSPVETWRSYASTFRRHSTAVMTPELLAALAQVEGSGNPIVRTYWRWSFTTKPFDVYKPASSAVGMYQITDGTFAEARRLCIHDHVVVDDGPWDNFHSCWFNSLYMRVVPTHAVEMTSAYLDRSVTQAMQSAGVRQASLLQQQELAAVIHLCGAGAGKLYAAHGMRLSPGQRCGDHDAHSYVGRVAAMRRVFVDLAR
jgi:hypothetical protein